MLIKFWVLIFFGRLCARFPPGCGEPRSSSLCRRLHATLEDAISLPETLRHPLLSPIASRRCLGGKHLRPSFLKSIHVTIVKKVT